PRRSPPLLHPEGPVPLQSRRAAASAVGAGPSLSTATASAENGREAYMAGRASVPGQRSGT
ncbi:AraC family transcriptional regulator, partial [Streptomyces sp. MBT33]|nr:AraC family transcriptional regulator [Streptomyces sp. MBT33]